MRGIRSGRRKRVSLQRRHQPIPANNPARKQCDNAAGHNLTVWWVEDVFGLAVGVQNFCKHFQLRRIGDALERHVSSLRKAKAHKAISSNSWRELRLR